MHVALVLDPMAPGVLRDVPVWIQTDLTDSFGNYTGQLTVFEDTDNSGGQNGAEVFDTLTLTITVQGDGIYTVPGAIGNAGLNTIEIPRGSTKTENFNIENQLDLNLDVSYTKNPLLNGGSAITTAEITLTPANPFAMGAFGVTAGTVKVDVLDDLLHPTGIYTATQRITGINTAPPNEPYTYDLPLTVYVPPSAMTVSDAGIADLGTVSPGTTGQKTVTVTNTGPCPFSIGANKVNLIGPAPNEIPAADVIVEFAPALVPIPGGTCLVTVKVPVAPGQVSGDYVGTFQLVDSNYPAEANVNLTVKIKVLMSGPILSQGTIYQTQNPLLFSTPQTYVFSAFVSPASGQATIGFMETDDSQNPVTYRGINIAGPVVTPFGDTSDSGVVETVSSGNAENAWYRVYFTFPYTFNPAVAAHVYLILGNTSPPAPPAHSVWFDGIQLEQCVFPDQKRPTSFHQGRAKLVSPNRNLDLSGSKHYYEW